MTEHLTRESVEAMCRAAPFADAEVGIPEMVAALRALVAERDAARAALEKIAAMDGNPCRTHDPSFGDGYDMAASSAASSAASVARAALAQAEHKTRGAP